MKLRAALCLVLLAGSSAHAADRAVLALSDLGGTPRSLEDHRGQVVVLNFWATWCIPCREEMPVLRGIHERYRDRGVVVIAASTDEADSRKAVERFVRRHKMTFPVWVEATVQDMVELDLGDALPATAILDSDGRVAFRILGTVTEDLLVERIDHLLDGGSGEAPEPLIDGFEAAGEDHDHGNDHDHDHGEEAHDHGGDEAGDSLVPS